MNALKQPAPRFAEHPAWKAALRAPVEPETRQEREAVAEAMRSGAPIAGAEITAETTRRSA